MRLAVCRHHSVGHPVEHGAENIPAHFTAMRTNPLTSTIRSAEPAVPLARLLSEQACCAYGLYPDNNVNGATWSTAVEIPLFKTRYVSNVQYMAFRQNDPFLNDAPMASARLWRGANQAVSGGELERRSERLPHQQRAVFAIDQRSDQLRPGSAYYDRRTKHAGIEPFANYGPMPIGGVSYGAAAPHVCQPPTQD
jgi:hypothetical protein